MHHISKEFLQWQLTTKRIAMEVGIALPAVAKIAIQPRKEWKLIQVVPKKCTSINFPDAYGPVK